MFKLSIKYASEAKKNDTNTSKKFTWNLVLNFDLLEKLCSFLLKLGVRNLYDINSALMMFVILISS